MVSRSDTGLAIMSALKQISTSSLSCTCCPHNHVAQAFLNLRQVAKYSTHFYSVFEDANHSDWFHKVFTERLAKMFQEGHVSIPGHTRLRAFLCGKFNKDQPNANQPGISCSPKLTQKSRLCAQVVHDATCRASGDGTSEANAQSLGLEPRSQWAATGSDDS